MSAVVDHEVRVLDQEIDAIEICPAFPEYMVIGTYSLVKRVDPESAEADIDEVAGGETTSSTTPLRVGSIQILPISAGRSLAYQDQCQVGTVRQDFPCAVLDLRFCPTDNTLLAASTSIGELRFFRVNSLPNVSQPSAIPITLSSIGIIKIYGEPNDEGEVSLPLVTQFTWVRSQQCLEDNAESNEDTTHFLATCDTTGQTILLEVRLPSSPENTVQDHNGSDTVLPYRYGHVHKHLHDLEAWTISSVALSNTLSAQPHILLSGGDDSCLIVSTYTLHPSGTNFETDMLTGSIDFDVPPARTHLDKRTHSAGVVSIIPLPPLRTPGLGAKLTATVPVLTGSYDQCLRLFLLDSNTLKFQLVSELEVEGGVWRITLLDSYSNSTEGKKPTEDYILLISAMHAGCYIVRLSHIPQEDHSEESWCFSVECRFTKPHESMVYACAARKVPYCGHGGETTWEVISTSFYDKRICVWQWIDKK